MTMYQKLEQYVNTAKPSLQDLLNDKEVLKILKKQMLKHFNDKPLGNTMALISIDAIIPELIKIAKERGIE